MSKTRDSLIVKEFLLLFHDKTIDNISNDKNEKKIVQLFGIIAAKPHLKYYTRFNIRTQKNLYIYTFGSKVLEDYTYYEVKGVL